MAARIRWIQFDELVIGENHPTEDDNDNRPLKDIILFSNLSPQAEDFPGFIGCYQGNGNPNGVQVGNIRNAFWAIDTGKLWMKQAVDNTDTNWVPVGGHQDGFDDPNEQIVARSTGDTYEQHDPIDPLDGWHTEDVFEKSGIYGEHPIWIYRNVRETRFYAVDWFNGSDDTDISTPARALDGGDVGNNWKVGAPTWFKVTGSPGTIDITSPGTPGISAASPNSASAAYYVAKTITSLTEDHFVRAKIAVHESSFATAGTCGVLLRFDLPTGLNGYICDYAPQTGNVRIRKLVEGVNTTLAQTVLSILPFSQYQLTIEGRVRNISTTECEIQVWINGRLVEEATDDSFLAEGFPGMYFENCVNIMRIHEWGAGPMDSDPLQWGWFGQNGFESHDCGSIMIGSRSVAGGPMLNDQAGYFQHHGCVAIGIDSHAWSQSASEGGNIAIGQFAHAIGEFDCVAIGIFAEAVGPNCIAIGGSSEAHYEDSLAIGFSAIANGGYGAISIGVSAVAAHFGAVAIGNSAVADNVWSVAIGSGALVSDGGLFNKLGIAIGGSAVVDQDFGIAIGTNANTWAANQLVIGGAGTKNYTEFAGGSATTVTVEGINEVAIGWGDTNATPRPLTFRITNAFGTDIAGGSLTFIAGRNTGNGAQGDIIFQTSAPQGSSSVNLQPASTRLTIDNLGIRVTGRIRGSRSIVTYSASMTPDAGLGNVFEITATNGSAYTINAPTNPAIGQVISFTIKNTSGGALGAATWNAVFKLAAWTNPGNGNNRSIQFYYDGTNWIEISRTTTDVPN